MKINYYKFNTNYLLIIITITILQNNLSKAQQQIDISYKEPNQVFKIEGDKSKQTIILDFRNSFIDLDQFRNTFLCFLVTLEPSNIQDKEVFLPSDRQYYDIENCLLKYGQIVSIDLNEQMQKLYITPIFLDEFQIINFNKVIQVETKLQVQYVPTFSKCDYACNGGSCSKIFDVKTSCYSCPSNRIGIHCGYSAQQFEGISFQQGVLKNSIFITINFKMQG